MDTRRKLGYGFAAAGLAIAIGVAGIPSRGLDSPGAPNDDTVNSVGFVELKKTLLELRVTWNPKSKARVLERARRWSAVFESPLLWLLARPDHELFADAIELTGEIGVLGARPWLVQLVKSGPPAVRGSAVVAAERLMPWSEDELFDLLEDDRGDVQIAALQVAGARERPPIAAILAAVVDGGDEVRAAALQALPKNLGPDERESFFGIVQSSYGEDTVTLLEAFAGLRVTDEIDRFLTGGLPDWELPAKQAAITALLTKGSRLSDPAPVWDLVTDRGMPLHLRAYALWCLEKTGSYDLLRIRNEPEFTEPVLRYLTARCLIDGGDRSGARLLLELAAEGAGPVFGEDQAVLVAAARRLLGQLSGTGPTAGMEVWTDWYWYGGPVKMRQLPEPPIGW